MRAVRLHGVEDLRVEDIAPPGKPRADEVRLRVTAAGICGSDLHNYRTGQWISRAPSTPGHELTGIVTALGPDAKNFTLGDTVVADSRVWCGHCAACLGGRPNHCENLGYVGEICDGGFAEEVTLPARLLLRIDPAIDPAIAATAEPLAVALHAVSRLRPPPGAPVLVAGCGPIGGLAALVLAKSGSRPLLVADRNPVRRALVARVAGATEVELDRASLATALDGASLEHVLEATGSRAAIETALGLVANGGVVVLVGIAHGMLHLDPTGLVEREISVIGCSAFVDELPAAIGLLPGYSPDIRRLIEGEITLDDVPNAYRRLIAGESSGLKTIVRP